MGLGGRGGFKGACGVGGKHLSIHTHIILPSRTSTPHSCFLRFTSTLSSALFYMEMHSTCSQNGRVMVSTEWLVIQIPCQGVYVKPFLLPWFFLYFKKSLRTCFFNNLESTDFVFLQFSETWINTLRLCRQLWPPISLKRDHS